MGQVVTHSDKIHSFIILSLQLTCFSFYHLNSTTNLLQVSQHVALTLIKMPVNQTTEKGGRESDCFFGSDDLSTPASISGFELADSKSQIAVHFKIFVDQF